MERLMIPRRLYSRALLRQELVKLPQDEPFCNKQDCPISMVFAVGCASAACMDVELTKAIDGYARVSLTMVGWQRVTPAQVIRVIDEVEARS